MDIALFPLLCNPTHTTLINNNSSPMSKVVRQSPQVMHTSVLGVASDSLPHCVHFTRNGRGFNHQLGLFRDSAGTGNTLRSTPLASQWTV